MGRVHGGTATHRERPPVQPFAGHRAELSGNRGSLFSKIDTDGDGIITRQEMQRAVRRGVVRSSSQPLAVSHAGTNQQRAAALEEERKRVNDLKGAANFALRAPSRPAQPMTVGPPARGATSATLGAVPLPNEAAFLRAAPRAQEKE